jgi:1-phosphatidylinositol phosphodiesterase
MSRIPDNMPIKKISIPGTHDTMAYQMKLIESILQESVRTQTLPLETQLVVGIRAFDIRCRHFNNSFDMYHGAFYLKTSFDDVLNVMTRFLASHPKEALLVRVQQTYTDEAVNRSFAETFLSYKKKYNRIWIPTLCDPSLGDVRGKIVILQSFFNPESYNGLRYYDFRIQDNYDLKTSWDLYDKWMSIKQHLNESNSHAQSGGYINYLSGSGGVLPYFVASGHSNSATDAPRLSTGLTTPLSKNKYPDFPRINCFVGICTIAFEGTNILTYEYIRANKLKYVGIIMADFPGDGLIDAIIKINFQN